MKSDRRETDIQLQYREQLVDAKMQISKIDKEMMDLKYRREQLEAEKIIIQKKQYAKNNDLDIFEALRQQRLEKRK